MDPSLRALVVASSRSVSTVLLCAGVGMYARKKGLLAKSVQRALEKLLSEIFLPSLVIVHVTPNMNPQHLSDFWPLAVVCVSCVLFGLAAGALVSKGLGLVYREAFPKFTGLIMVACAFPNSFTVPIMLTLTLGDQPVFLTDGLAGGDALTARINMLFLMAYPLWILARWSIGFPIMSGVSTFEEWRKSALNTPVIACFMSAVVGLMWSFAPAAWQPGGDLAANFAMLSTPFAYAGRCAVPTVLMMLGARLDEAVEEVRSMSESKTVPLLDAEAQEQEIAMPFAGHVAVVLVRQVLGPIFGALVMLGFFRGVCGVVDSLVLFVGMMQCAGPPMVNITVMAGLSGTAAKDVSRMLLITYVVSMASWVVAVTFFLHILD